MKCKIVLNKSLLERSTRAIKANLSTWKVTSSSSSIKHLKLPLNKSLEPNKELNMIKLKKKSKVNESSGQPLIEKSTKLNENLEKDSQESHARCCCCCSAPLCSNPKHDGCKDKDESIVRQPINLGTTNVRQIFQCVHNGTAEIKDIILNECNIIYECRSCRSLFRSLSNLLSHKRQYCKDHICEQMILFDETLIKFEENGSTTESGSKRVDSESENTKSNFSEAKLDQDLNPEVDQASEEAEDKTQSKPKSAKHNYLESCLEKIMSYKKKQEKDQVEFKLIKIPSNPNAVYQKINPIEAECTQVKIELESNQEKLASDNQTAFVTDDNQKQPITKSESNLLIDLNYGNEPSSQEIKCDQQANLETRTKSSMVDDNNVESDENLSDQPRKKLKCQFEESSHPLSTATCHLCNSKFSSKKTLNVHLQTIHSMPRLVYPCPFCYLTFKQLFNATRHMIQVHRKGKTQVKFLREAVRRRAYPEIKSENSLEDEEEGDDVDFDFGEKDTSQEDEDYDEERYAQLFKEESEQRHKEIDDLSDSIKLKSTLENGEDNQIDHDFDTKLKNDENMESLEVDTSELDQEQKGKKKGVNPIFYSCTNECGRYFIKLDSKVNHEKKCTHRLTQKSSDDKLDSKKANSSNPAETKISDESITSHVREENGDLIIPESIYKDIKKFGDTKHLKCNNCPDLHFKSKPHLIQHLVLHIGCEVIKCKGCSFQTLDKSQMNHHLETTHGIPETLRDSHILHVSTPLKSDSKYHLSDCHLQAQASIIIILDFLSVIF